MTDSSQVDEAREAEAFKAWYAGANSRNRGRYRAFQAGRAFERTVGEEAIRIDERQRVREALKDVAIGEYSEPVAHFHIEEALDRLETRPATDQPIPPPQPHP